MWLITALVLILGVLILIVIMDTSMKLALMITTLYNYDTKKLFIPATLTVALWLILLFGCFNTINNSMDGDTIDILFTMIFDSSLFEQYKVIMIKPLVYSFIIGTILQSFTYYTVNINYQKVTGTVRFSLKRAVKKVTKQVFKKDIMNNKNNVALSEVHREPKKLTFGRALTTSIIAVVITLFICILLFVIGQSLSETVINL